MFVGIYHDLHFAVTIQVRKFFNPVFSESKASFVWVGGELAIQEMKKWVNHLTLQLGEWVPSRITIYEDGECHFCRSYSKRGKAHVTVLQNHEKFPKEDKYCSRMGTVKRGQTSQVIGTNLAGGIAPPPPSSAISAELLALNRGPPNQKKIFSGNAMHPSPSELSFFSAQSC